MVGIPYIGFLVLNIGMIFSVFGEAKEKQLPVKRECLQVSVYFCSILVLLSMLIAWTPITFRIYRRCERKIFYSGTF